MQFFCQRDTLMNAITTVQRAIASRSTMPILEGIFLDAAEKLTLTGYDMEIGMEGLVDAEVREAGSVVMKSRIFGEIVRKLPEDRVKFTCDEHFKVTIESGSAHFTIFGQDASDYPKIPTVEEAEKLSVPERILKAMIGDTIYACSSDGSRPVLKGIKVQTDGGRIEMVASDGFRLAVRKEEYEGGKNAAMDFIVPSKAMAEIARAIGDSDDAVAIYPSHNHILFETARFRLVSRLLQGDFIDYHRILPEAYASLLIIPAEDMLEAIERAALIINVDQRRFPISLDTETEDELQITSRTDVGEVDDRLAISLQGEAIHADFNPKYFLEALRVIHEEKLQVEFNGSAGPCLIKPLEKDNFLHMLLPLRR